MSRSTRVTLFMETPSAVASGGIFTCVSEVETIEYLLSHVLLPASKICLTDTCCVSDDEEERTLLSLCDWEDPVVSRELEHNMTYYV